MGRQIDEMKISSENLAKEYKANKLKADEDYIKKQKELDDYKKQSEDLKNQKQKELDDYKKQSDNLKNHMESEYNLKIKVLESTIETQKSEIEKLQRQIDEMKISSENLAKEYKANKLKADEDYNK